MFISKKTHDFIVSLLTEQYEARLSSLSDQIQDLKRMVFSPTSAYNIPPQEREADAIISISERPADPETYRDIPAEDVRESELILSGNYEEELLN